MAGCQQGAMSVGGEQARRVCVQVYSWGRLSTGGSADRHCKSSHDTVGADCQREATPAGAAPAMEKSYLWPSGPHRETKKKISFPGFGWASSLPLSFLSDDMTLGHLGSPCHPESVADVVDNRQDVASVISNWPAIARGYPRFSRTC